MGLLRVDTCDDSRVSLALDSIQLLCKQTGGLGVRELARELGVGKGTVHRILQTLVDHVLARQDVITARLIQWLV